MNPERVLSVDATKQALDELAQQQGISPVEDVAQLRGCTD